MDYSTAVCIAAGRALAQGAHDAATSAASRCDAQSDRCLRANRIDLRTMSSLHFQRPYLAAGRHADVYIDASDLHRWRARAGQRRCAHPEFDIGGMVPGSNSSGRRGFRGGLRLPVLKLYVRGVEAQNAIWDIITAANVQVPDKVR